MTLILWYCKKLSSWIKKNNENNRLYKGKFREFRKKLSAEEKLKLEMYIKQNEI